MKVITIEKAQWSQGLTRLQTAYRLFGPVKDKTFHNFKELDSLAALDLSYSNTRLSAKSLLFPQSEDLLVYNLDPAAEDANIMKEAPKAYAPRAVIGIRPCDAKAVSLVKMNFDTDEYKDPYWLNLHQATTFVGLACDAPCSTCFCTTAGCGPYHEEGLDLLLADGGDHLLAKVISEKGQALLDSAGWRVADGPETSFDDLKRAAEEKIVSRIATESLAGAETMDLYQADFWEDVAFACINCGTCTFVCPTCWCFDIQDEIFGKKGKRLRNWDSCMFPIFTVHTTGHNPRGTKVMRVRQRFMHKLKYFVDKYNQGIMCVGCGRCVRQCPVNIDIRRVCELMNNLGSANACSVQG